jgi:hypothetical protein
MWRGPLAIIIFNLHSDVIQFCTQWNLEKFCFTAVWRMETLVRDLILYSFKLFLKLLSLWIKWRCVDNWCRYHNQLCIIVWIWDLFWRKLYPQKCRCYRFNQLHVAERFWEADNNSASQKKLPVFYAARKFIIVFTSAVNKISHLSHVIFSLLRLLNNLSQLCFFSGFKWLQKITYRPDLSNCIYPSCKKCVYVHFFQSCYGCDYWLPETFETLW